MTVKFSQPDMTEMKKIEVPTTTVETYRFDHRNVPVMIQFVIAADEREAERSLSRSGREHMCKVFNCVLTSRAYKSPKLTDEQAAEIVRRERNLPATVNVVVLYNGHPRDFVPLACTAWKEAYAQHRKSDMRKIQSVLDILSPYDIRKGRTYEDWKHRAEDYASLDDLAMWFG